MDTPSILVDDSAAENGLAQMLGDLLRQNLQQKPKKIRHFKRLKLSVAIEAKDAEVQLTIFFNGGSAVIYDGMVGDPDLSISTGSETILGLSNAPLRSGLPDLFQPGGRSLAMKILSGELKIKGLFRHPLAVVALTNVFSIHD